MAGKVNEEFELAKAELQDLCNVEQGLDEWSVGFIESICGHLETKNFLSKKQMAKIHELWDRYCK